MAKQTTTDGEFTLQRQARRRLLGATALMLAMVIFLPMIFDADPAANVTRDIELRIPEPVAAPVPVQKVVEEVQQNIESTATPISTPIPPPPIPESTTPAVAAPPPQPPVVIAPAVKPPVAAPRQPAGKSSGWVIQVGAYSKAEAAKQMVANLKQRGYPVYTEKVGTMVRVRVGHYPTKEAAEKIRAKLEGIGLHPNVLNQD